MNNDTGKNSSVKKGAANRLVWIVPSFIAFQVLVLWGVVWFLVSTQLSAERIESTTLPDVMFGTATLVLTGLATVLALAGFVGWAELRSHQARLVETAVAKLEKGLQDSINAQVESSLKPLTETISKRLDESIKINKSYTKLVVASVLGYLFEAFSPLLEGKGPDAEKIHRLLDSAIDYGQATEAGEKDAEVRRSVVNNLVWLYSLRRNPGDFQRTIPLEAELREMIQKAGVKSDLYRQTLAELLLAFCQQRDEPERALREASIIIEGLGEERAATRSADLRALRERLNAELQALSREQASQAYRQSPFWAKLTGKWSCVNSWIRRER